MQQGRSNVTLFVYDEAGHLIGEYDGSGNAIQEHVWFTNMPVAVLVGSSLYYVHTDQLGTPRIITDGNAAIWRWESGPFGEEAAQEDPDGDQTDFTYNLRFPGQYYDVETGLHYNYYRTYDPATGRYLESDPVGLGGGLDTYGYVSGNPLSGYDLFGLTDVLYDANGNTITVTDSNGNSQTFPAANNATRASRGPWPAGQYQYDYYVPHTPDPNGPYGSNGNFVFKVPGCVGCGIHSGRQNRTDRAGRSGVDYATEGCIRTTDAATSLLDSLRRSGDPIRNLTVVRGAPAQPPAPTQTVPAQPASTKPNAPPLQPPPP